MLRDIIDDAREKHRPAADFLWVNCAAAHTELDSSAMHPGMQIERGIAAVAILFPLGVAGLLLVAVKPRQDAIFELAGLLRGSDVLEVGLGARAAAGATAPTWCDDIKQPLLNLHIEVDEAADVPIAEVAGINVDMQPAAISDERLSATKSIAEVRDLSQEHIALCGRGIDFEAIGWQRAILYNRAVPLLGDALDSRSIVRSRHFNLGGDESLDGIANQVFSAGGEPPQPAMNVFDGNTPLFVVTGTAIVTAVTTVAKIIGTHSTITLVTRAAVAAIVAVVAIATEVVVDFSTTLAASASTAPSASAAFAALSSVGTGKGARTILADRGKFLLDFIVHKFFPW